MGKEELETRAESLIWEDGWVAIPVSLYFLKANKPTPPVAQDGFELYGTPEPRHVRVMGSLFPMNRERQQMLSHLSAKDPDSLLCLFTPAYPHPTPCAISTMICKNRSQAGGSRHGVFVVSPAPDSREPLFPTCLAER